MDRINKSDVVRKFQGYSKALNLPEDTVLEYNSTYGGWLIRHGVGESVTERRMNHREMYNFMEASMNVNRFLLRFQK